MGRYRCICADPPWLANTTSGRRRAGKTSGSLRYYEHTPDPYPKLSVDEIAALPVADLAADRAHLFMWVVDEFLADGSADRIARAWGFVPTRKLIVWSKRNAGLGHPVRAAHEMLLLAQRGKLPFARCGDQTTVQDWPQVYVNGAKKHSAKPPESFELIERLSPDPPRLELFAREARPGWDCWGNEVDSTVELAA
jgi:N6-adenosine-specific RNA methylase IME4